MAKLWGRLSIQNKIFAALALILLLMAAMLAIELAAQSVQRHISDRLIERLLPERASVRNVKRLVLAADDEGAWYLLAADRTTRRQFLVAYNTDAAQIANWLQAMQRQAELPEKRIVLANAQQALGVYLSQNRDGFHLARQGRISQARKRYVQASYKPLMQALSVYEAIVEGQIAQAQARSDSVRVQAEIAAVLLGFGALVLAILTAVRLGGSLRRRLHAVSGAIADVVSNDLVQLDTSFRNIAAEDFTAPRYVYAHRPIEDTSSDELGLLARSYNGLVASLRQMSKRIDQAVLDARRRKEAEERIAYLEQYDEVTGLANRYLLHLELQHAMRLKRRDQLLAVACLGLVGFEKIEDSFGHDFAQQALRAIADRLTGSLRETDMAARSGSIEFIVVLDPVGGRDDAADLARRLLNALSRPFEIEGRELLVNVCGGMSFYPYDGQDADELLRNANTALSYARELGSGELAFYASQLRTQSLQRVTIESDLQRAIEESQFEVHYQPIVNVAARRIDSFEALLRWHHPRLGLLEPGSFIDVAEDTAAIERLGSWVLETACAQAQQWRNVGFDVGISVNVSMRQFRGDLFKIVEQALWKTRFPAHALNLELTESLLLTDRQGAAAALADLKRLGVRLSIDDFGTGYSSLAYLRTFPLDGLKIDRSFVSDITKAPYDKAIANTIILLGHSLGVRVVAEGVEDAGQAAMLHKLGCDAMQGYFFGRPAPARESFELLKSSASAIG